MTRRYRFRRPLTRAYSLEEQLDDVQWDYRNWNVHATTGPKLRKGTILFIKNSHRFLGWPSRPRPRWRTLRPGWRQRRREHWVRYE